MPAAYQNTSPAAPAQAAAGEAFTPGLTPGVFSLEADKTPVHDLPDPDRLVPSSRNVSPAVLMARYMSLPGHAWMEGTLPCRVEAPRKSKARIGTITADQLQDFEFCYATCEIEKTTPRELYCLANALRYMEECPLPDGREKRSQTHTRRYTCDTSPGSSDTLRSTPPGRQARTITSVTTSGACSTRWGRWDPRKGRQTTRGQGETVFPVRLGACYSLCCPRCGSRLPREEGLPEVPQVHVSPR